MHVAVVSRIFTPEPGAASLRLSALVTALADAGSRVTVLTVRPPRQFALAKQDLVREYVSVRRAPVLRDRAGYVRGYLQYLSFDVLLFFRLLFLAKPDVVVVEPPPTTGVVARMVCALRRIPYVYYAADLWSDAVESTSAPKIVHSVLRATELAAMKGAQRVLCVSDDLAERLSELGVGSNVVTVGNGADLTQFSVDGEHAPVAAPYLLYAGTASEVHGATIFLEAYRIVREQFPESKLIFIGQGSDWAAISETAATFPDGAVLVLPRLSPGEVSSWFRGAHASLASVKPGGYVRAFPTKVYASAACGTSVIFAGAGPGGKFAQATGRGWSVDYSVEAITQAMTEALHATPTSEDQRALGQWAADNISLQTVASRGAREVRAVAAPPA